MEVQVEVPVGDKVRANVRDNVGVGVAEATEAVNGCKVGEMVGVSVRGEAGLAKMFPSASESEKPPKIRPVEARATSIPRKTCRKFFTASPLQTTLPQLASRR